MQLNKELWDKLGLTYKKADITFEEDGHTYKRNDGKLLTGVTTVENVLAQDWAIPWGAKMATEYLNTNWDISKVYTDKEKADLLLLAKKHHKEVSGQAKNIGKIVHEYLDHYDQGENPIMPVEDEAISSIMSYFEFKDKHDIKVLLTEEPLEGEQAMAGTLDRVWLLDGVLTLADFKTSKNISKEYYLQTAAYNDMLRYTMGFTATQRAIVRIPKDGGAVECAIVPTDEKFDLETFYNLRNVHRWLIDIANNYSYKPQGEMFKKLKYETL